MTKFELNFRTIFVSPTKCQSVNNLNTSVKVFRYRRQEFGGGGGQTDSIREPIENQNLNEQGRERDVTNRKVNANHLMLKSVSHVNEPRKTSTVLGGASPQSK